MIYVIQADNRTELDFLKLTRLINERACTTQGWIYEFHKITEKHTLNNKIHFATAKIPLLNEIIQNRKIGDYIIFLDSDAWIHNSKLVRKIIDDLDQSLDKHGCFSRDPYFDHNTYVNSGSFILKITSFTREMYEKLSQDCIETPWDYVNISLKVPKDAFNSRPNWPYDQHYVSKFVYNNNDKFIVYNEYILNTPIGLALRHYWLKTTPMYEDLERHINNPQYFTDTSPLDLKLALDDMPFPNKVKEPHHWIVYYCDAYLDVVLRKYQLKRLL